MTLKHLVAVLIVGAVVAIVISGNGWYHEERPQQLYREAQQLAEQQRYDEAIEKYQIIIRDYPDSEMAAQAQEGITRAEVQKVAAVPEGERGVLPPPEGIAVAGLGNPALMVENGTEYVLTVRYAGPMAKELVLQPQAVGELILLAGTYQVAASVSDPSVVPFYGKAVFEPDHMYESVFYIVTVPGSRWP